MAATYCPEDDKLRLYVGRVPRDEYEALRSDGWVSTPKQSEAGKGEFAAVWTVSRYQTALKYADDGIIDDEDAGPVERAADRAERFGEYRDKRTSEAVASADRYESSPSVHGFQNQQKADRAAARVDRIAGRACDSWSKAEYWTSRTAGVISHALYNSTPSVRMGRIMTIEADLRRAEKSNPTGLYAEHLRLRLAYENQMLDAQGGRAAFVEMIVGGWLGNHRIVGVNKSTATGRVTSVEIIAPYKTYHLGNRVEVVGPVLIHTERLDASVYRAPTDEELAAFHAERKAAKKAAPKATTIPLINPTDEDAERLQAIWNAKNARKHSSWSEKPRSVTRMTQAEYSAHSKGSYSPFETVEITGGGFLKEISGCMNRPDCAIVAKVRSRRHAVIVITDKPQKPLTAEMWHDPRPAIKAQVLAQWPLLVAACGASWSSNQTAEQQAVFEQARIVGWAYCLSLSQFGLTDEGRAVAPTVKPVAVVQESMVFA